MLIRDNNNIDQLMIQGQIIEDPSRIREEIIDFCNRSYISKQSAGDLFTILPTAPLFQSKKMRLSNLPLNFEEQEVLWCTRHKALGSYGSLWISSSLVGR